jgi:hypothetical protein
MACLLATAPSNAIPERPEKDDEAAIYGVVMFDTRQGRDVKLYVITESTTDFSLRSFDDRRDYLHSHFPDLPSSVYDDFGQKLKAGAAQSNIDTLQPRAVVLGDAEMNGIFGKRGGGWDGFYRKYPGAQGITTLSQVGFSKDRHCALVYVGTQRHDLSGTGTFYELTKTQGKWVVVKKLIVWVS